MLVELDSCCRYLWPFVLHKSSYRQTASSFVFTKKSTQHHENKETKSTLERIPSSASKKVYAMCPFSHSISSCEMKNESYISSESTWQIARFKISTKGTGGEYSFIRLLLLYSIYIFCYYWIYYYHFYTVFENHRKSLIQHCERSELRLHFEWTKVN